MCCSFVGHLIGVLTEQCVLSQAFPVYKNRKHVMQPQKAI